MSIGTRLCMMNVSCIEPYAYPHKLLTFPIRLQVTYQFYACPSPRPVDTLVQLQMQIPALVSYVLGPTWRDEQNGREGQTVPQLNCTADDEANLTLRVLRGSGAVLDETDKTDAHGQW
jgi:hypothetical protein